MSAEDGEEAGGSGARPKRNMPKVDYKKMHSGELSEVGFYEEEFDTAHSDPFESQSEAEEIAAPPSIDPEVEMQQIRERLSKLDEEETLLKKSQELRRMREELKKKEQSVKKLRGRPSNDSLQKLTMPTNSKQAKSKHKRSEVKVESKSSDTDINIQDLRNDDKLRKMVRKELVNLGLESDGGSSSSASETAESSSNSSSGTSSSSDSKSHKKHKKKKSNKKKSGISAKASDKVKYPQKWPHSHLQFEYVNKQVKYDELDFKLFIAGELEIISEESLPRSERKGRLNLLKKIVYYSNTYDFKGLKSFYAAWLREIELGKKSWTDDSQQIESAILTKHIRPHKPQQSKKESYTDKKAKASSEEKIWFCSAYQRNKCTFRANHMVVVKGQMRMATHICATCWQRDKNKLEHPECSSSCPYASA